MDGLRTWKMSFALLLRAWFSVQRVREMQISSNALMFSAYAPPFPVAQIEMLTNLHQQGRNLEEVSLAPKFYNLSDLFCNASLLSRFGLVLLGNQSTTGFGKTQFALRLACEWAKAYVQSKRLPQDQAVVVFCNTLDVIREVVFRPGMVLVIDGFTPSDQEQVIYMSETIMKCMCNPAQGGSVRARNGDIQLIAQMPRIFTGNADSIDDWCGSRFEWSLPLQRKSIVFQVVNRLVSNQFRSSVNTAAADDSSIVAQQSAIMKRVFQCALPPVEVEENVPGLFCRRRR